MIQLLNQLLDSINEINYNLDYWDELLDWRTSYWGELLDSIIEFELHDSDYWDELVDSIIETNY